MSIHQQQEIIKNSFNLHTTSQINSKDIDYTLSIEPQEFEVKESLFDNKNQNKQEQKQDKEEYKRYKKGDNLRDYADERKIEINEQEYYRGLNKYQQKYRSENKQIISIYPDKLQNHICPICRNKFNNKDEKITNTNQNYDNVMKYTRECGHNICEICINQLQDERCPLCNKNIKTSRCVKNRIFNKQYFEEDDFLCPNCNFPFDNDIKKPVILTNCGHTYCHYCVEMNCIGKGKDKKVLCKIDSVETKISQFDIFENRLFKDDIEIKKKEDIEMIKDNDISNIYYCMKHYVPIKLDSNYYHRNEEHFIISNDDIDFFMTAFTKEYDKQKQQIKDTFIHLGDLDYKNIDQEYQMAKKAMIDARVEFKYLKDDLIFLDNQQHLQQLNQYLDQQYNNKFEKDQMNKFWNYTREISFLKQKTQEIFQKIEQNIEKQDKEQYNKIYSLPNLFILFFKLEKIRQQLCKKYEFLYSNFMYNTPAIDQLLRLFDKSKQGIKEVYNKLKQIKDHIEVGMENIEKITKQHEEFVQKIKKQKKQFEDTKFVQSIVKNFHSYFINPNKNVQDNKEYKQDNEEYVQDNRKDEFLQTGLGNIVQKTLDKKISIQEVEWNMQDQSIIEMKKDLALDFEPKNELFQQEQEEEIKRIWLNLYKKLEEFGTDNLFTIFNNNSKVLKFLKFK